MRRVRCSWRRSPRSRCSVLVGTAIAALQGNENAQEAARSSSAQDNDNVGNGTIQPIPSPPGPDQSLNKSDLIDGGLGPDTLIGRLGTDVFRAAPATT